MSFNLLIKIFIALIAIYLCIVIFVYTIQRSLLYVPDVDSYEDETLTVDYQEVNIVNSQGDRLRSIFYVNNNKTKTTLLMLHGNAGPLENRFYKINKLAKFKQNILLISWRGYSGNTGIPSEKALYDDAESAVNWLKAKGIKKDDIILYGESLGTGIVTELSSNSHYKAVILEAPFTSMIDAAKYHYPYLPVSLMLKDKYLSKNKIIKIKSPILIMHSKKDEIVPFWMGEKLFELANQPKMNFFADDTNHLVTYTDELMIKLNVFYESLDE